MSFKHQLIKYPIRTIKTGFIGLLFISVGISIASIGPALLDLQILANTDIQTIASILPTRSFGYVIGSVIAGVLADKNFDHQILIMISLFFLMISTITFVLFPIIKYMYISTFIGGISNGSLDTLCTVWCLHIWGKDSAFFMQTTHLFYGLGAFLASFVVEPFLTIHDSIDEFSFNKSDILVSNHSEIILKSEDIQIQWPFIIISIYDLFVLCAFCLVYFLYPDNSIHPSRIKNENDDNNVIDKKDKFYLEKSIDGLIKMIVIVISTLLMHSTTGLEISFGSLLSPYAVKSNLRMTKSEGAYVTGFYWGFYTFLRIFSSITIIYFSPRLLLFVNTSIIMLSNFFLIGLPEFKWALFVGAILMGTGTSSCFALVFAFLEQLMPVSARITSGFMIFGCLGEFIIPYITAKYIENKPEVFLYVVLIYSLSSFTCISILIAIQWYLLRKQNKEIKNNKFELRTSFNQKIKE